MKNKEILQQMYADFSNGNIPGILNVVDDNVYWDSPGPEFISWMGVRNGKDSVMEFFQQVGSITTYEKFEPQTYVEENDKIVATGVANFTNITTGKKGVSPWIMSWTFKDGKATSVRNLWDTFAIAETFK